MRDSLILCETMNLYLFLFFSLSQQGSSGKRGREGGRERLLCVGVAAFTHI